MDDEPVVSGEERVAGPLHHKLTYAIEFARLAEQLNAEPQEQQTLERIVMLAVETVEAASSCSVTLVTPDGALHTAAQTDETIGQMTKAHQLLGQGPYWDAAGSAGDVVVDDLGADRRWPQLSDATRDLGLRAMFCIRLPLATRAQVASLNLAADRRQAFDTTDIAIASIFARHAAAALDRARDGDDLRAAVRSRQLIGVAEGILMQRFGLGLDQAFELLRRYSQSHNIKLRVLAERLVETGQLTTAADATRSLDAAFGLQPED